MVSGVSRVAIPVLCQPLRLPTGAPVRASPTIALYGVGKEGEGGEAGEADENTATAASETSTVLGTAGRVPCHFTSRHSDGPR